MVQLVVWCSVVLVWYRGGGSGGGRIVILYNQGYVNNGGTISVSGGVGGGTAPTKGGDGGAGSITIKELQVL